MNHLPVYSRPFDDDDFEELSLDDEHVELASELREYSEDDYDDEFTEQERRELVIAPLSPPRSVATAPAPKVLVARRVELEPTPPPTFVLGPGQLPPRPSKLPAPAKKVVPPAKKMTAKKVSGAKAPVKSTIGKGAPGKKAAAPTPAKKIAAKKVVPAKKAAAKKK